MHKQRLIFLLYMLETAISFSSAFNIDLRNPDVYTGDAEDFFGYKVLQVGSKENKGIIVTAPLHLNGSGAVYRRGPKLTPALYGPEVIKIGEEDVPVKYFGLSIAKDFTRSEFTVCSPSVVTKCNENSYMNSVCYKLTDQLEVRSSFKPAFQECTKKKVDLVFMFDGSKSMQPSEFEKNKEFIEDIMRKLKNSSISFAAVQFATNVRTVFNFNDYRSGDASGLLQEEQHMYSLTNTHKALRFVLKEHFESTANGATPEATKVLVVITDGDPSDSDSNRIVMEYDSKNIIRFVIGVKDVNCDKLKTIASEPKDKNCFHIESYKELTGVLENFQKKIFQTEGTKAALAGDLTEEMSQSGFSATFSQDSLILGSVGSNTWRGSLHEHREKEKERQIKDPEMKEDSYMGYSVSAGERNKTVLYFTGAPRYNHKGQVILFTQRGNEWTPIDRINGEQLGSYFGAELCSVDVDSDGNTDFLLVGAPLFLQNPEKKEGKIYIYRLTDELKLENQLKQTVTAPAMGRFGTSITSVADLNGDQLRDVVVGAPLENQNRGAVYVYLGDRSRGIRSTYNQRIMGEKIRPELRFFGQSVDGSHDLGEDGLPDLVVGSRGSALVFRSKPVFNVTTRLSFEPEEISIENIICPSDMDDILPLVTLSVCFEMVEVTRSTAGAVTRGMNISYTLNVDPMRQTFRGFFNSTTKSTKSRNLMEKCELRNRKTCFNHSVYILKYVIDTLSAISIKLNFSQVDSERADVVLNADSEREASVEVPFERRCRNNDTCIAELEVDFNFTTLFLLVADGSYLSVTITLSNHGEDAYNTSLTMHHPPGLAFSKLTLNEETKSRPLYNCEAHKDGTACGISLPVYRNGSAATFTSVFHVIKDYEWKNNTAVTIVGNSDNQKNSTKGSLTKNIPVKFGIKMTLLIEEETITYLNFTTGDNAPKRLVTKYKVDNHGWRAFPATVLLFFPTKLEHNFEIRNYKVLTEQATTQCRETDTELNVKSKYCTPERKCTFIICDTFILKSATAVEFEFSAEAQFKDLDQHASNKPFLKKYTGDGETVQFKSFLYVQYDKQKYALDFEHHMKKGEKSEESGFWDDNDPSMKSSEIQIELIVLPNKWLIIATGGGLGLLLLIILTVIMYKLGFFKRKTPDMFQEDEEEGEKDAAPEAAAVSGGAAAVSSGAAASSGAANPSETKGRDEIPEEDKALLEKQEATTLTEINDLQNGHK